jgi:hypothetical protein
MNLKLKLFEFRNGLKADQYEVHDIVSAHFNACENFSEKEIMESLSNRLSAYAFYPAVNSFLESTNEELSQDDLLFTLKDVYAKLVRENEGNFLKMPLDALMEAINAENNKVRLEKVLSEVSRYDWVPQIKGLLYSLSTSDMEKANLTSKGGVCEDVYAIVAESKNGKLAYIANNWFLLGEEAMSITTLEENVEDEQELYKLKLLETAVNIGTIDEEGLNFKIDNEVNLSVSTSTVGKYSINGEAVEEGVSVEDLFQMPIIAMTMANCYPVVKAVSENSNYFCNLDIATKVTNVSKPTTSLCAIKYNNKCYTYTVDSRYGSSLHVYESATAVIESALTELETDLSFFYSDMLTNEQKQRKQLEKAEEILSESIANLDESIDMIQAEKLTGTADEEILEAALAMATEKKSNLTDKLKNIKLQKTEFFNKTLSA